MQNYIDQMTTQRSALLIKIKNLEEEIPYADGLAWSELKSQLSKLQKQVALINNEVYNYTFVGPKMPEWVRAERQRVKIEELRSSRVQAALLKMESFFGIGGNK